MLTIISCQKSTFLFLSRIKRHFSAKTILSFCALGDHIAGPFDRFNILNCTALSSVTRPVIPPRASISLTICPLATPPIAGLHDICAIVPMFIVAKSTLEPIFAAAAAASHPAWPAPTTITSYFANIFVVFHVELYFCLYKERYLFSFSDIKVFSFFVLSL